MIILRTRMSLRSCPGCILPSSALISPNLGEIVRGPELGGVLLLLVVDSDFYSRPTLISPLFYLGPAHQIPPFSVSDGGCFGIPFELLA